MLDNTKREEIYRLRHQGFSYAEIASLLHISKTTVARLCAPHAWSQKIMYTNRRRAARDNRVRITVLNSARKNQLNKAYAAAQKTARIEFEHFLHSPLFMLGLGIYMAEGDTRSQHYIRLSTRHIHHHVLFIQFAERFLGVDRRQIKFWLHVTVSTSPRVAEGVWARALTIPQTQFSKTQVQNPIKKQGTDRLHSGTGNTIIGDAQLKEKLKVWLLRAEKIKK